MINLSINLLIWFLPVAVVYVGLKNLNEQIKQTNMLLTEILRKLDKK